jgi:uncharacterized protein involved in outer membrane biogenesis
VAKLFGSKRRRVLAASVAVLLGYGLAGFLVAPRLLRSALLEQVPKQLGLTASVGAIRLNPFLLQLTVEDLALAEPGGERLVGCGRLGVELAVASLWQRAFVFRHIELESPFVHALVGADGRLNLLQLQPKSANPPAAANESLPRIRIGEFRVARGVVSYEDRSRPAHFTTVLAPINFDLRDFRTDADSGVFTLSAATELGERFNWQGHLGVQPLVSDGELHVAGLQARTVWSGFQDGLGFTVDSGRIDIDARYRFALREAVDLQLDVARIAVSDLAVSPRNADRQPWIKLPQLTVRAATVDLDKRRVHVDSIDLTGLELLTWLEADRTLNLAQLATVSSAPPAAAPPGTPPPPATPWVVDLGEFALLDARISVEDRSQGPGPKFVLAPLSLQVSGASLDLTRAIKLSFDTKIDSGGEMHLSGMVTPQPFAADLELTLGNIGLAALQPYIARQAALTLLDGQLGAHAKIHYGASRPRLTVAANLSVLHLHTVDNALRDDFIAWDRLDVIGLAWSSAPDRLSIERIVAHEPYARVIIEADSTLNAKRILAGPVAPSKSAAAAMPVAINSIEIDSGRANFSDLSISPNFSAGIQALHGTVRGLSSVPTSRAVVDLHGEVDPYAPVAITGDLNLLSPALYTDLALDFRNIELSIFNPYSGKFAGYEITKGKLTTEFKYSIAGRRLDAKHHIIVDQLEFGEKTASKDAVSLPVKLAVALLKDRRGVIDLDLPVGGSLDDPSFKLGPVVWKVLENILVKAVSAPFALLGSLFGGGPDLQFIDFRPGSAELDAAGLAKLDKIVKALQERPQLKLEVPIAALPDLDREGLVEARFREVLASVPPAAKADPAALLALKSAIVIEPAALKELAEQRALRLQQALLANSGLDPERVFLVANAKIKQQDESVRLELSLQ